MTVVVAGFIASVYLAALATAHLHAGGVISTYARLADHFELLGFLVVGAFVAAWAVAALVWRFGHLEQRTARPVTSLDGTTPTRGAAAPRSAEHARGAGHE